ncbi:hypothetical protein HNQ41_001959 [Texcoconibacillus texcoconensis]|uniref:Uncharacterized protein n=1 Tax=Texcoconibacillus texcoconensis TaxID=1095777 RepID=A0A840QQZ3_9BACI|nr:hypothetical protein [Texcoconibacillus texcoconensis]
MFRGRGMEGRIGVRDLFSFMKKGSFIRFTQCGLIFTQRRPFFTQTPLIFTQSIR